jgi:Ca2+-binding RTX toxin-like protein
LRIAASDGQTSSADAFKLVFNPTNDAPVVARPLPDILNGADGQPVLKVGTPFTIPIPASTFTDIDGDALQFGARIAGSSSLPSWMTFDGTKLTGTAPASVLAGQSSADLVLEILATDGTAQAVDTFTVRFGASTANPAPVVGNDGPFGVYAGQPIDIPVAALLANDTDPNGDALSIVSVQASANASVTLQTNGTATTADDYVRYLSALGFSGTDQFQYTVSDGVNQRSGTVSLAVDGTYAGYTQGTSGDDTVTASNGANSTYFGGAGDDIITGAVNGGSYAGGSGDDTLIARGRSLLEGNDGDDTLIGGSKADTLSGGTGDDLLTGGAGKDVFIFRTGDDHDVITDFDAGRRTRQNFVAGDIITIDVDGIDSFADLMGVAQQTNGGVLFAFGNGDELFLQGTQLAALDKDSFTFA